MSAWTNEVKNSASWTHEDKTGSIDAGMPIGLLLSLTYALSTDNVSWAHDTKNSTTWALETKN